MDTAKQLLENNITLYGLPGTEFWKQFLLESSIPEYNKLGETFLIPDNWDHYYNITEHDVIGTGTHAWLGGYLFPKEKAMGRWHRSKEKVSGDNPFGGYLTNKKWNLNEVFSFKQFVLALSITHHN